MSGRTIQEAVWEIVRNDAPLCAMLAKHGGKPAFFYSKAPSDEDAGWEGAKYPRADFTVDMRQDPERRTAGSMWINIYVTTETLPIGGTDPDRAIEWRLSDLLSGTFYSDEMTGTFCTEWERSDAFHFETQKGETHPEVYGLSVRFEIMEFPPQFTTDPDPVQGLNRWTKDHFTKMAVIGYDKLPDVFRPSDGRPAVYWRFDSTAADARQGYAATWYTGVFYAHVIAQSVMERNRWIKAIAEKMQLEGEVILPDTSPLFVNRIAVRHAADPLREGQLELTGRYGVLAQKRKETAQLKLMHAPVREGRKEGGIFMDGIQYSISDFARHAKQLFGTTPEAVTVALKMAGKEMTTPEEAKAIVKEFLEKEVK